MRAAFASLLAFMATTAQAGVIAGLAGSIDNAAQAASLQGAAKVLSSGNYVIKNVGTGKTLTYRPEGNHIVPAQGDGSPIGILGYGGGVSWLRLQIGEDKCLSSQWGGSYNLAGVAYSCAVDAGGDVTRKDNTLEPTKQWWIVVPVSSNLDDVSHASNNILLAAQANSVKTREKAQKKASSTKFTKHHSRAAIVDMDQSPNRFELVSRAKKGTRPHWKHGSSSSSKKSKSSAAAAKKKKAAEVVKKAKAAAAAKKAVAKKQKAKSNKKSSKKSSGNGKKSSGVKNIVGSGLNVKLNAAVSQRYFIIPVDHLIDMHTLALTGHEIESYRAQSTALDLWDASDKQQQWTITRVN